MPFPTTLSPQESRTSTGHDANRRVGALMVAVAASLAVASFLHLDGDVHGGAKPFDPSHAGIAEAIICAVLVLGVLVVFIEPKRSRQAVLFAVGFAIAGFLLGLSFTLRGGDPGDVIYHLAVLPLLIGSFVVALRRS